jgi:hypothetical protein
MKYVSIDIETTGLDHNYCQVLEFAAIVDDLKTQPSPESLPKFQTYVLHDYYIGEPYALSMHAEAFRKIANWEKNGVAICRPDQLFIKFHTFLTTLANYTPQKGNTVKINVAGKNFGGFDSKFLEKLPGYGELIKFHHRFLDPGTLYLDADADEEMPGTEVCLKRAGITSTVAHTALDDALVVIDLLRKKFPKRR